MSGDERAIFGDKAYPSKDLKMQCRQEGIYYGILDKAYRNNLLSSSQTKRNSLNRPQWPVFRAKTNGDDYNYSFYKTSYPH